MIRILIFIGWVIFFAAALTALLSLRETASIEAFGWRMELPIGVAAASLLASCALLFGAASLTGEALTARRRAAARRDALRREKGLAAVTKGLDAIAAGDAAAARRQAAIAGKALGGAPVARLIAAQAAQLAGDEAAAGEALAELLDHPETEFLALRGLYARAEKSGDAAAARRCAERAFELRPTARWAFEALVELALRRGDFDLAARLFIRGGKAGTLDAEAARRGAAAAAAAAAYAAHAAGDATGAQAAVEKALQLAPGLAPAALLAAILAARSGAPHKAEKLLRRAYAAAADRALAETAERLAAAGDPEARADALARLAECDPEARESDLLRARAALLRSDPGAAIPFLERALRASASARALALMAEAQMALRGEAAGHPWLVRAASAPREAAADADAYFRLTLPDWARLVHAYAAEGSLSAAVAAGAPPGLDEADLLLAPPAPTPADEVGHLELDVAGADHQGVEAALDRDAAAARGVN
jgi:HemY protein